MIRAQVIHRKSGQPVCKPVLNERVPVLRRVHPADMIDFFLLPYNLL